MQRYLRGQIWWCNCSYDVNSTERDIELKDNQKLFNHIQQGMRPVLIVSNDVGNKYSSILQVVPCTSSPNKTELPTHCSFYINKTKNIFLCEQAKTVNKSDVGSYLTTLDEKEMAEVERCLQIALGLIKPTQYEKIKVEVEDKPVIINKERK